jgi:hypothetical protein
LAKETNTKKTSLGVWIVVMLIAIFLFIGIPLIIIHYSNQETQSFIDDGCDPSAWNLYGHPTIWKCPTHK